MSATCRDVLDAALQLSPEDRGIIAEKLLETLSPDERGTQRRRARRRVGSVDWRKQQRSVDDGFLSAS